MQRLGQAPLKSRPAILCREVIGKSPNLFDEANLNAMYQTFLHLLEQDEIGIAPKKIGFWNPIYRPKHLLDIKVQYFIEMVNAEANHITYEGWDTVAACFYRKNWNKPFEPDDLERTAKRFKKLPLYYAAHGIQLFGELVETLRNTFPVLYDNKLVDDEEEENIKLYDMLNGLSGHDVNKWEQSANLPLHKAFRWLEQMKIQQIKEKHGSELQRAS